MWLQSGEKDDAWRRKSAETYKRSWKARGATYCGINAAAMALPDGQEMPQTHNEQVVFYEDQVRGQFTTQLYGKDVVVTLSGKLASEDGYVTFQPTQFKVGELSVPISLVDSVVQKKLNEPDTREKLKLPDWVAAIRVQNGQLVVTEK